MGQEKFSLVSVMAHNFDGVKGCGGTFAKYSKRGHRTTNIVMTGSSSALLKESSEAMEEGRKASEGVMSDCRFLKKGTVDFSNMENDTKVLLELIDVLRELKADIIFTHWPEDTSYGSLHHRVAAHLTNKACMYLGNPTVKTDHQLHKPRCLLYALTNTWTNSLLTFVPDLFIDISDTIHLKVQALQQVKSHGISDIHHEGRIVPNRMYGLVSGCFYAEAFKLPFSRFHKLAFDEIPKDWLGPPSNNPIPGHPTAEYPQSLPDNY